MSEFLYGNWGIIGWAVVAVVLLWGIFRSVAEVHQRIDRVLQHLREKGILDTNENFHQ